MLLECELWKIAPVQLFYKYSFLFHFYLFNPNLSDEFNIFFIISMITALSNPLLEMSLL